MVNQELTSINQWFTAKKFSLNVKKLMLTKFFFQLYCILFIMLIYDDNLPLVMSEADVQRCSVKKVFLEISQNSQENTCARHSGVSQIIKERCIENPVKHLRWSFLQK